MKNGLMVAVLVLTACGVSQTEVIEGGDELGQAGDELSTVSRTYVTLKRDFRKCMSPMCGGWFVTDVNRVNPTPRYVSALDWKLSGLDETAIQHAFEGAGDLVLRGKLGPEEQRFHTRTFLVTDAWRGMPGITVAAGDRFLAVEPMNIQCFAAPCPIGRATRLNSGGVTTFHELDLEGASFPRVDQQWLASRINLHKGLVAASFVSKTGGPAGMAKVLTASQVFVKLPEAPGPCPAFRLMACESGKVRTWHRNADRCELPGECVIPGMCAQYFPSCEEGYTLQSWSGGMHACQVFACDPTFSL